MELLAFIHFSLYCWIFSSDNNGARLKAVTAPNVVFHFCITLTKTQKWMLCQKGEIHLPFPLQML